MTTPLGNAPDLHHALAHAPGGYDDLSPYYDVAGAAGDLTRGFLIGFTFPGTSLSAPQSSPVIVLPFACTLAAVTAYAVTAPTGSTLMKVDVNYDLATIYGTHANQPTWTASQNQPTVGATSVTSYAAGHLLSVDLDSVGSTVAGGTLQVGIWVTPV